MSMNKLAAELLRQILIHLDDYTDFNNASLVCRSWVPLCREINFSRMTLILDDELPPKLAPLLKVKKTNIPRQVHGIIIDEAAILEYAENDDEITAWREDLVVCLNHFDSVSNMTIKFLDLTKFSLPAQQVLRPGIGLSTLVIQSLKAERLSDVVPFVLENRRLTFLGLGSCTIHTEKDEAVDKLVLSTDSSHLTRLRHLVIFGQCGELIPSVMDLSSPGDLKMIVAICNDNGATARLVNAASLSLRALALGFANEEATFDLGCLRSLQNLSIDISSYPRMGSLLANLVQTVSSAPGVEHLFINVGPGMVNAKTGLEGADALWKALDARLVQLPGLKCVAFTMVLQSCIAMFMGVGGQMGGVFDDWKNDVLKYAEAKLPACREKGLVQVKQLVGSWTAQAFADASLPE